MLRASVNAVRAFEVAAAAKSSLSLQSLAKAIRTRAEVVEGRIQREKQRAWRIWLGAEGCASGRPSRAAYRWIRGHGGWSRSPVGNAALEDAVPDAGGDADDGTLDDLPAEDRTAEPHGCTDVGHAVVTPLAEQAAVDVEAAGWSQQWAMDDSYTQPIFDRNVMAALPLLTVLALRVAAMTFPAGTGLGGDNVAPRAFGRLSDSALSALARILMAAEALGAWGQAVSLVLIVLLPKPDGGLRPIGLFPTIIRVWMRARTVCARAWEAANAMPQLFGGAGMGAQRAAWTIAFRAEAAALTAQEHAVALLDLVKAFERVPHHLLAIAAARKGYPLVLLRLSLAAYRLQRVLGCEGVFSRLLVATRGITAGSGLATTELRLLLIDVIIVANRNWPMAQLVLYVDDLTVTASAAAEVAARIVAEVVNFIVLHFQQHLRLEVSATKSVAVGSRVRIARDVTSLMRRRALEPRRTAKGLGAAVSGGRRRSMVVPNARLKAVKRRLGRLRAFRRAGGNAVAYVRTAAIPAITYAADIMGVADSRLQVVRSTCARMASPAACGKNPDMVFYALDAGGGATDPAIPIHTLAVGAWACAWWEQWVPQDALVAAHAGAVARLAAAPSRPWLIVSGPVAALIATTRRIGWEFLSPRVLRDDIGRTWDLLRESPAAVKVAVADSVRRWRFARILKQFPAAVSTEPDCGIPISLDGEPSRASIVTDAGIRLGALLRARPAAVEAVPAWDAGCRPWLVSAMTGGQWAQARRAAVRSWDADPRCQLCLAQPGTLIHRRTCTATVPTDGWATTPHAVSAFSVRLRAERLHLMRTRAVLAVRVPRPTVTDDALVRWRSEVPDLTRNDLIFYTDGSLMQPRYREFKTAGCAVVIVSYDGALVGIVEARLPSRVGTASEAEARAFLLALTICPFTPIVITDCLSLLATAQGGLARATASRCTMAGVWTLIGAALDGDLAASVEQGKLLWMPSHLAHATAAAARKSDGSPVSVLDWRANRLADAVAKSAAGAPASTLNAVRCLKSAGDALLEEAAVLGAVTRAANTHRTQIVTASGNCVTVIKRDSIATVGTTCSGRERIGVGTAVGPVLAQAIVAPPAPAANARVRKRPVSPGGMSADVLARTKTRRVAALGAVAARARGERVAMRILDDAAAARAGAVAAADGRITSVLGERGADAFGVDPFGRAFAAAVGRVREVQCEASPLDRLAALRTRVAARQRASSLLAEAGGASSTGSM
jgi:hypothetical protein